MSVITQGQGKLRDILLPYGEHPMPRVSAPAWDKLAWQFSHLCRMETAGQLRHDERVAEWMSEYAEGVVDFPIGRRADALRSGPILYEDHVATRLRPLMVWLERAYGEQFTSHQLAKLLKSAGWENKTIWVTEDKRMKIWVAPANAI